jgi:hypothetical protein
VVGWRERRGHADRYPVAVLSRLPSRYDAQPCSLTSCCLFVVGDVDKRVVKPVCMQENEVKFSF